VYTYNSSGTHDVLPAMARMLNVYLGDTIMASYRARKRKRSGFMPDMLATSAEREGLAISTSFTSHTIDFGIRLNKYYYVDGYRFNTGKKHRANCTGQTACERKPAVRRKHKTKHVDLRHIEIDKWLANPQEYMANLQNKRIENLCQYKAGIVKPISNPKQGEY